MEFFGVRRAQPNRLLAAKYLYSFGVKYEL